MASAANLFLPRGTPHIICYPLYVFPRFSRVTRFSTRGTRVRQSFIISIVLNDMLWHFPALGTGDAGFPCLPLVLHGALRHSGEDVGYLYGNQLP